MLKQIVWPIKALIIKQQFRNQSLLFSRIMESKYNIFAVVVLVGLCAFPLHAAHRSYTITSTSGFKLTDQEKEKHNKIIEKQLTINLAADAFVINEVKIKPREILIESIDGVMAIDKVPHQGSIIIMPTGELKMLAEVVPDIMERKDVESLVDAQVVLPQDCLPTIALKSDGREGSSESKKPSHVRVLLSEQPLNEVDLRFFSDQGFVIAHSNKDPQKIQSPSSELHITAKKGELYANGKRFVGPKMIIAPKSGHVEFGGNTYQGIFNVITEKKKVLIINSIDVEDYIFAVVRSESWPNWPLEVNKVFAIACRSYVIAMCMRAKKTGLPYHIRNTNKHQKYDGFHTCPIIRRAIDETRGVFLAYDQIPIIAMFDSCCGGVIPAHVAHMNFDDAPYLARDYACTHCERCKIYSWETSIAMEEFENMLKNKKKKIGKVKGIKVAKKDKAGLVREVTVRDSKKTLKLTGKEMYSLIKDVKSYCFTVTKNYDIIEIKGRGYGHHVGLCQWGAREMVRDGWDYKSILEFYYPGTEFMKLG
jgi:stage II sporulation protein D